MIAEFRTLLVDKFPWIVAELDRAGRGYLSGWVSIWTLNAAAFALTAHKPSTILRIDHEVIFSFQVELGRKFPDLSVNLLFILGPGTYTKVEFYRIAYTCLQT